MLSDDVYDAFVLVPLYLGMYYKEDIHIHGCMSKKLYKNVMTYLQRILCDFSDDLSRIDIHVDGFKAADGEPGIIGTGISCGVDSLTTIYDHYVNEDDPDYRINGLFFYNCGSHGGYGEKSEQLFFERYALNKSAADDLGLPVYLINSNLHAFLFNDQTIGYLARYSCILGVQRAVKKYYVSSCYSYSQILTYGNLMRTHDFAEFSESYSLPLIQTERTEMVIDGCQYTRSQKTEHIADWDIAQKHLNVCINPKAGAFNCSKCQKCMTTLIALEAINKLEDFSAVFDISTYKKYAFRAKAMRVVLAKSMLDNEPAESLNNFARQHGLKMPSYLTAWLYCLPFRVLGFAKRLAKSLLRKIIGDKLYDALKKKIKH